MSSLPTEEKITELIEMISPLERKYPKLANKALMASAERMLSLTGSADPLLTYQGLLDTLMAGSYSLSTQTEIRGQKLIWETAKLGASYGVNQAAKATSLAIGGFGVISVSSALAPWLGAFAVAGLYSGISGLYDIRNEDRIRCNNSNRQDRERGEVGGYKAPPVYTCLCDKCNTSLDYLIDKLNSRAFHTALKVGTFGLYAFAKGAHSFAKSRMNNRPMETHCRSLILSVRTYECPKAMATIMFLVANNESKPIISHLNAEKTNLKMNNYKLSLINRTLAIVMSCDGWQELKRTI